MAEVARALSHPARVKLVRLLASQSECRGADVFAELPLAQSTISEHLKVLRDAGLVSASPLGTSMVYCLQAEALEEFSAALDSVVASVPTCNEGSC